MLESPKLPSLFGTILKIQFEDLKIRKQTDDFLINCESDYLDTLLNEVTIFLDRVRKSTSNVEILAECTDFYTEVLNYVEHLEEVFAKRQTPPKREISWTGSQRTQLMAHLMVGIAPTMSRVLAKDAKMERKIGRYKFYIAVLVASVLGLGIKTCNTPDGDNVAQVDSAEIQK